MSEREREKIEKKCQATVEWTNSNLEAPKEEFQEKGEDLLRFWNAVSSAVGASPAVTGVLQIPICCN